MLVAISLFIPCFFGLGLLGLLPLPRFWSEAGKDPAVRATAVAATLALGITGYYSLFLAIGRPEIAAAALLGLAAAGWIGSLLRVRRDLIASLRLGRWAFAFLILVVAAAAMQILLRPLMESDARTIWFHHAKMIFYFGDLEPLARWGGDWRKFAHTDYPKLLATLAATAARLAGFWNEYFPKLALLALALPPLVATLAFAREPIAFVFVLVAFFCVPATFMWNGFMDGYLALYAGFAAIHLGRWLGARGLPDLIAALAFLGVVAGLKNEGNLLLVAIAAAGLLLWLRHSAGLRTALASIPAPALVPALVAFSGFCLWHYLRRHWHLETDLRFGPEAWARAVERLSSSEALAKLGDALFLARETVVSVTMLVAMLWLFRRWLPSRPVGTIFALAVALLYFGGVLLIYLMTPYTLNWHLGSSAERVLMIPRALVFAAIALWLQERERAGRAVQAADDAGREAGAARRVSRA